jgi:small subunit ribosomal protein S17e
MGRIKTQLVKRTTINLIKEHPEAFTTDFTKNKTIVSQFLLVKSKKIRNVIAGYVTRLIKFREQ